MSNPLPRGRPGAPSLHMTLGALLRAPYEYLQREMYAELARGGFPDLRPAHSAVLRNIAPEGSRVTVLADRAGMAKQSMAYLVDQMQALGYLETVPDPDDGRAKIVRLTRRGEALLQQALALSRVYEDRLGALIGRERMRQLRGLLAELHARLEDADAGGAPAPESAAPSTPTRNPTRWTSKEK